MADIDRDFIKDIKAQSGMVEDYVFFAVAVDAIVVNPAEALDPDIPCRCVRLTKENGETGTVCWKRGMVGLIGEEEVGAYCPADKRTYPKSAQGLEKRIMAFQKASEACQAAGADTLEERLSCMSVMAGKNGQKVGQFLP